MPLVFHQIQEALSVATCTFLGPFRSAALQSSSHLIQSRVCLKSQDQCVQHWMVGMCVIKQELKQFVQLSWSTVRLRNNQLLQALDSLRCKQRIFFKVLIFLASESMLLIVSKHAHQVIICNYFHCLCYWYYGGSFTSPKERVLSPGVPKDEHSPVIQLYPIGSSVSLETFLLTCRVPWATTSASLP